MRRGLTCVAALLIAGCKVAATGVLVEVTGDVHPDQLRVVAVVDGQAQPPTLIPPTPQPLALPQTFFAEPSHGGSSAVFEIDALAGGALVGRGRSTPTALATHQQPSTTVPLAGSLCALPGAMPSSCAGTVLCDSFEAESGQSFSSWTAFGVSNAGGGAANPGTSLAVSVGPPVCAGNHALHAVGAGASQQAFVYKKGLSLPSTTYLRAFVYLPAAAMTTASFDLFSFATDNVSQYLQIGYDAAKHDLFVFRNFASQIDFATTLPTDRWICLELALGLDAAAGSIAVTVDGVALGKQTGLVTQPAGASFSTLDAGLVFATGDVDLYLDELALSATPIGCF